MVVLDAQDIGDAEGGEQHNEIRDDENETVELCILGWHWYCYYTTESSTLRGMKLTRLERIYAGLLFVVLGGIVIHAPLSVWLGTLFPGGVLAIKSWKEILLLLASLLAIVIITKRHLWRELADDWLLRILAAYVFLHLILAAVLFHGATTAGAGLLIDLRYVGFFGLLYILMKIAPWYRLRLLITAAVGAMVVMGFGVLQLFLPADILSHIGYSQETIMPYLTVDKNPEYIRINSTLRGPNPLGAYAVIVLAMIASITVKQRYRLKTAARRWSFVAMTVATLVVLWVSYSRSALVAAAVAICLVPLIAFGRRLPRWSWVTGAVIVVLVLTAGVLGRQTSFVDNVILHDNPGTGAAVTSNEGHVSSLVHGINRSVYEPFGAGIGSTGSASLLDGKGVIVENQYLFVAHEAGWLGLALFLVLFVMILRRLWRGRQDWLALGVFASGIGLALIGLLLPVWADDTVSLVWWGLAGIALGTMKGDDNERTAGK